jgi:Zn-dependent protease with chaperone function/membrane associated rhomboid family serine protease
MQAAVALVVVAVPVVYLALVAGAAWGVYRFARHAAWLWGFPPYGPALHVGLVVGGTLVVVLAVTPLMARTRAETSSAAPFTVTRDEEPELAAFLDDLCGLVDATRPERIAVDLSTNASGGLAGPVLGRGRFVVSFGLPLAAVLDAPAFAAVLVHELAHCRQGIGLRLHVVVGVLVGWLGRVLVEQEAMGARLGRVMDGGGVAGGWLIAPVVLPVVLAQGALSLLVQAALRANMALSRVGEFDADRLSAAVAGRDAAVRALRSIHGLDIATGVVDRELSVPEPATRPDDLVASVQLAFVSLTAAHWRHANDLTAREQPGAFDSHPALAARLARLAEGNAPGVLDVHGPASALFRDFAALGQIVTARAYDRSPELRALNPVPAATFLRRVVTDARHRVAIELFLGGETGLGLDPVPERAPHEETDPPEPPSLEETLARLDAARSVPPSTWARADAAFTHRARLTAARASADAGLSFDAEALGVDSGAIAGTDTLEEAVERCMKANDAEWEAIEADVAPLRRAATEALGSALRRLHAADARAATADALLEAVNLFARQQRALFEAGIRLAGLHVVGTGAADWETESRERAASRLLGDAWLAAAPLLDSARALVLTGTVPEVTAAQAALPLSGPGTTIDAGEVVARLVELRHACLAHLLHLLGLVSPEDVAARLDTPSVPEALSPLPLTPAPTRSPTPTRSSLAQRLCAGTLPVGTLTLAGINVATFVWWVACGADPWTATRTELLDAGAAFRPLLVSGEWWRLLTAPFANDCAVHLLVTLAGLAAAGPIVERLYGRTGVIACYAVIGALAALTGALVSQTGIFCTAAPAVTGLAVLFLLATIRVPLVARMEPLAVDQLQGPRVRAFAALVVLPWAAMLGNDSSSFVACLSAAALGAFVGFATISDARTATPGIARLVLVVCAAAVCAHAGFGALRERAEVRAAGLTVLIAEERALRDFARVTREVADAGDRTAAQKSIRASAQDLHAAAYAHALSQHAAAVSDRDARRTFDRYGRLVDLAGWLEAREQVALGDAYLEYLGTRAAAWDTRLHLAREGRFDALAEHERDDARARAALRWRLVSESSPPTQPPGPTTWRSRRLTARPPVPPPAAGSPSSADPAGSSAAAPR